MYKYHNGLLPSAFDSLFTNLGSVIVMILETLKITVLKYTNKKCYIGWTENMEQYTK